MSQAALDCCCREACPDEPLDQGRVCAGELVEVREGLPLLEDQLYLPSQPVSLGDLVGPQNRARYVGHQRGELLDCGIPEQYQTQFKSEITISGPVNDHFDWAMWQLGSDVLKLSSLQLLGSSAQHPSLEDRRVQVALAPCDEEGPGLREALPVVEVLIPAVQQQQLAGESLGRWQKVALPSPCMP